MLVTYSGDIGGQFRITAQTKAVELFDWLGVLNPDKKMRSELINTILWAYFDHKPRIHLRG